MTVLIVLAFLAGLREPLGLPREPRNSTKAHRRRNGVARSGRVGPALSLKNLPSQYRLSRMHYRWDGRPKRAYVTSAEAQAIAEDHSKPKHAYYCSHCDHWHVGTPMRPQWHHTQIDRHSALQVEIGDRVMAHLWAENYGRPAGAISKRFRTAQRLRRTA